MQNDVKKLILDVGEKIKAYSKGQISFEEAKDSYQNLSSRYSHLSKSLLGSDSRHYLEGMLAHHNRNNYTIASALIKIHDMDYQILAGHGESRLVTKAMEEITGQGLDLKSGTRVTMTPRDNSRLSHTLHIRCLTSTLAANTVLLALTSSDYFSPDYFEQTAAIFKNLLSPFPGEDTDFNYFQYIASGIRDYITEYKSQNARIVSVFFVFKTIDSVFLHMGIPSILELSGVIKETIQSYYKNNSRCYSLSVREYIALYQQKGEDEENNRRKKIDFSYRGITIPYDIIKLEITDEETIQQFWNNYYHFSQYIIKGDVPNEK